MSGSQLLISVFSLSVLTSGSFGRYIWRLFSTLLINNGRQPVRRIAGLTCFLMLLKWLSFTAHIYAPVRIPKLMPKLCLPSFPLPLLTVLLSPVGVRVIIDSLRSFVCHKGNKHDKWRMKTKISLKLFFFFYPRRRREARSGGLGISAPSVRPSVPLFVFAISQEVYVWFSFIFWQRCIWVPCRPQSILVTLT